MYYHCISGQYRFSVFEGRQHTPRRMPDYAPLSIVDKSDNISKYKI